MPIQPGGRGGGGVAAAFRGDGLNYWINNKIPGAVQIVLTDGPAGAFPGVYYNLERGDAVLISQTIYGVNTLSDSCEFELGYTTQAAGAGTFYPIWAKYISSTGGTFFGVRTYLDILDPPLVLRYLDGVRSITFRVNANDAACEITAGWRGWKESELV
jgi:hypothetical protein